MKRRRVIPVLIAAIVTVAFIGGIATERYALADEQGPRAECIILSNDLDELTYDPPANGRSEAVIEAARERGRTIVDRYNELCR